MTENINVPKHIIEHEILGTADKTYVDEAVLDISGATYWNKVSGGWNARDYLTPKISNDSLMLGTATASGGVFRVIGDNSDNPAFTINADDNYDCQIGHDSLATQPLFTTVGSAVIKQKLIVLSGASIDKTLTMGIGTSVDEFSTDVTLGTDSDDALVTEHAIKTYVDGEVSGTKYWTRTGSTIEPTNANDIMEMDRNIAAVTGNIPQVNLTTEFKPLSSSSAQAGNISSSLTIPDGTSDLTGEVNNFSSSILNESSNDSANFFANFSKLDHHGAGTITNGRSYMTEIYNRGGGQLSNAIAFDSRVLQYYTDASSPNSNIGIAIGGRFSVENALGTGTITKAVGFDLDILKTAGTITEARHLLCRNLPAMSTDGEKRISIDIGVPLSAGSSFPTGTLIGLKLANFEDSDIGTNHSILSQGGKMYHEGPVEFNDTLKLLTIKTGSEQLHAGAAADEVWKTTSHLTLPNNVLMIGV